MKKDVYKRQIWVTAGTGTGKMPCWQRTVPIPSHNTGTMTSVIPRLSRQTATDKISTMESTAPTSWKCTSSTGTLWAFASALALSLIHILYECPGILRAMLIHPEESHKPEKAVGIPAGNESAANETAKIQTGVTAVSYTHLRYLHVFLITQ